MRSKAQMNGMKTIARRLHHSRNLGDEGATLALREAIKRGWVQGPADYRCGKRHLDHRRSYGWPRRAQRRPCRASAEPGESMRRGRFLPQGRPPQIDRGADVIKFATTGGVNSGTGTGDAA
jgi:hypothetical protein